MNKRVIVTVAAGAALSVGLSACKREVEEPLRNPPGPEEAPPPPEDRVIPPPRNPPMPTEPVQSALPAWEDVKSGHPEGATNPPFPVLVVTPEGDCYKGWQSPMVPPAHAKRDRVEPSCEAVDGENACGTPVQCPPKAQELLAAWKADQGE